MHGAEHVRAPREFLCEIYKLWREVMYRVGGRYKDDAYLVFRILASHISQAVEYPELAKAALNDPVQRLKFEEGLTHSFMDLEMAAGMHLYIDRIPLVVSLMRDKTYQGERRVIDIWWTLIFRAMLWHRGHNILKGKTRGYGGIPVSPSFWGSKLPVYIA